MGRGGVRRRNTQRKQQQQQLTPSPNEDAAIVAVKTGAECGKEILSLLHVSKHEHAPARLRPDFKEVFAALESLYADELKPFGRILRKRVAELAGPCQCPKLGRTGDIPDVDMSCLRNTCEDSDFLSVQPEDGGDWSALIVGREAAFVDVYSPDNTYPLKMWQEAETYFQSLSEEDMTLPGGRYSCAQALHARDLAFLQNRSLGQVCQIVQLAISQKRLLGYLNGAVVPYALSRSKAKQQCAQERAPCIAASQAAAAAGDTGSIEAMPMATWETARLHLRQILDTSAMTAASAMGMVPLSNVKRLFRSKFHTELSETMLGHSKLSELLQDPHFSDICAVQLQDNGYAVVQVEGPENRSNPPPDAHGLELPSDSEPHGVGMCSDPPCSGLSLGGISSADADAPTPFTTLPYVDSSSGASLASLVQRTFIHAALPPPTPPPNARRRAHSLPKDLGCNIGFAKLDRGPLDFMPRPLAIQHELTESTADSAAASAHDSTDDPSPSSPRSLSELPRLSPDASPDLALEDPVKILLRECSLSWAEDCMHDESAGDFNDSRVDGFHFADYPQQSHRLPFCPDEPLTFDDAELPFDSAPRTQTPTPGLWGSGRLPRWSGLSPSCWAEDNMQSDEPTVGEFNGSCLNHCSFAEYPQQTRLVPFCPDEPLAFEDADLPSPLPFGQLPRRSYVSPALLARDCRIGSIALSRVQNTFIHSPLLPPTPLRGDASCRARSLPKNVGSDKNALETAWQALGYRQMPLDRLDRLKTSGREECSGASLPTPSTYEGYEGTDMPRILASPLAFWPPSPAMMASPTHFDFSSYLPVTCSIRLADFLP